jgi:TRAP-type transport system small permease protein
MEGKPSRRLDRIIGALELVAAWLLAVVTALTFVSVFLRYIFNWSIPDSFDISRNFLGIVIFWGIALAGFRAEHITVDLLWSNVGPSLRRLIDTFAGIVAIICMAAFTWAMTDKVLSTRGDNVLTFDVHLPVWIFFAIAWIGIALSVPLLLLRAWRGVMSPAGATPAPSMPRE